MNRNNQTEILQENELKFDEKIEKLAMKLSENEDEIERLEKELKELNQKNDLIQTELTDLMDVEGYGIGTKIILKNGKTLLVKEFFNCCIPSESKISKVKDPEEQKALQEKKELCFQWLNVNGLDGIIKNTLTANFDKGENNKVKEIMLLLQEKNIECESETNVHASTLKATLKEVMRNGVNVPFELFDIYTGMVVELK